ncbi:MAG TPA: tetratricopeptide repeat protein [Sedimentisphaerales bacterium]|jgi:tetratricopeptide (TPR) repeat protein|nr:tetratricopeptide repeat protein [Sedimentisphaerales bacterium]HNU31095.1 tetratricopeptide repeat protein [Sedimentisphaerales bacterium]
MMNFQAERLRRLPQHPREVWQGGITRLPLWVRADDEGLPDPVRSWAAGWVSLQTRAVFLSDGYTELTDQSEALLDALVDLAYDKKLAGYRPGKVQVCDPVLAEYLRSQLEDAEITVELIAKSFILERSLTDAAEASRPYYPMPCGPMDTEGVTVEMVRAYTAAAGEFYRARPWELLANDDLIVLESPDVEPVLRHVSVLGSNGGLIGLAFHESRAGFERFVANPGQEETMGGRYWLLRFGTMTSLPFGDVDLWERYDLPVAGPDAYPFAICYEVRSPYHRPGPSELAFFEGFMRALAQSTEQEFDSGRWTKQVDTFDEPMEFAFTLPDVLAPERPRNPNLPLASPLVMDRIAAHIERMMKGKDFKTREEYEAFIQANFLGKRIEEFVPHTPLEEAQDIVFRAYSVKGRKQIHMARKALAVDPNCADAYILLGERTPVRDKQIEYYTQAVQTAERTLAPEVFEKDAGRFWEIIETRPYVRARFRLAHCLNEMGRLQEAADHFRELLRLNPDDNQAVRFWFWPCLLRLGRDQEVEQVLRQNKSDQGNCTWDYTRALLAFRKKGDTPTARRHLHQAIKNNPIAAEYLMKGQAFPKPTPDGRSLFYDEEATFCADVLAKAWHETTGAAEWLDGIIGWSAEPEFDDDV